MVKKLQPVNSYHIEHNGNSYLVTMVGLKNDRNGNKRYEATITGADVCHIQYGRAYSFRYTFTGHCFGEDEEALWIVAVHERKMAR